MFTIPNILSAIRLLGVPLFLALILSGDSDAWAITLLMFAGLTDYLDGFLARKLNQYSRIGELLDPLADRLYIAATLIGLTYREITPIWLILTLVARDLVLAGSVALLKVRGFGPIPVIFLGKAATLNLLYAFPLLLWASGSNSDWFKALAIGFVTWGSGLYLVTGWLYLHHSWRVIHAAR